jgi:death on curing protein
MEIEFLTERDVLQIHQDQIVRYGGSLGVLNQGQLESALAMPQQQAFGQYLHQSIPEMAAAYAFYLIKGHPFRDGNKRVGMVAASVFLALNGLRLVCSSDEFARVGLAVADGSLDKPALAHFFANQTEPL